MISIILIVLGILKRPLLMAQLLHGIDKSIMIALEFKDPVELTTPKGDGYIWYMIDYGPHSDTLYTIVMKETGECWQMSHRDFRVKANVSLGIGGNYQDENLLNQETNKHHN